MRATRVIAAILTALAGAAFAMVGVAPAAHADPTDYRSLWHLDPNFPRCITNTTDTYVSFLTCYPDRTKPQSGVTFVYGQMAYDDGQYPAQYNNGQAQDATAEVSEDGSDPFVSNVLGAPPAIGGWWAFVIAQDNTNVSTFGVGATSTPFAFTNGLFAGDGSPSDTTKWESPVTQTSPVWGNATEIPEEVMPSPPTVQVNCAGNMSGPPGSANCTAAPTNNGGTQSPTFSWEWAAGGSVTPGNPSNLTTTGNPTSVQFPGGDTNFAVTLTASADGGFTQTVNDIGSTAPCSGFGCLEMNTTLSPAADNSDPASEPAVGQQETITSVVTNTNSQAETVSPVTLTTDPSSFPIAADAPGSPSSLNIGPGGTGTFTWTPTFTLAGTFTPNLQVNGTFGAGRTDFGSDDGQDITVSTPDIVVNSTGDSAESAQATTGVCDTGDTVTDASGNDVPECTLRAAIQTVDAAQGGTDPNIQFNIPGDGPFRITPMSSLPPVTVSTGIDATTEPGYTPGTPVVILDGSRMASGDGLVIQDGPTEVLGLDVVNFPGAGVAFDGGSGSTLDDSLIGFEPGSASAEGSHPGVRIRADSTTIGSGVTVGGQYNPGAFDSLAQDNPQQPSTILGQLGAGILVDAGSTNTTINDATIGTAQNPNSIGVMVAPALGGTLPAGALNVQGGSFTDDIGVLALGEGDQYDASLSVSGSTFANADPESIGVLAASTVNVVSLSTDTFGTDVGVAAVRLPNAALSVIGDSFTGKFGLLSLVSGGAQINGNTMTQTEFSILIGGEASVAGLSPDTVTGNQLSSAAKGVGVVAVSEDGLLLSGNTQSLGSAGLGLLVITSSHFTVSSNSIIGSDDQSLGLLTIGSSPGTVSGNTVTGTGWDLFAAGSSAPTDPLAGQDGVSLAPVQPAAVASDISTDAGEAANIAGDWQTTQSLSASEIFGRDLPPTALGITGNTFTNSNLGILLAGLNGSAIGGPGPGAGNTLTGDSLLTVGIAADTTTGVTVQGNTFGEDDTKPLGTGKTAPVIDLLGSLSTDGGAVANHVGGAVTGPNGYENAPVVNDAFPSPSGTGTQIDGTLNADPNTAFTIDVYSDTAACSASGRAGLSTPVGEMTAITDANGNATWTLTTSSPIPMGQVIGATSTSAEGTSEPSVCQSVTPGTVVSGATQPGVDELPVGDNTGFQIGEQVTIDPGAANAETATISGFGSLIFTTPLKYAHQPGEPVVEDVGPGPTPTLPESQWPALSLLLALGIGAWWLVRQRRSVA